MTKEEVTQKIKEILAQDKRFKGATVKINFKDKWEGTRTFNPKMGKYTLDGSLCFVVFVADYFEVFSRVFKSDIKFPINSLEKSNNNATAKQTKIKQWKQCLDEHLKAYAMVV